MRRAGTTAVTATAPAISRRSVPVICRFAQRFTQKSCVGSVKASDLGSGALTDLCASACLADGLALVRVDFLEIADALFADVVANHLLALPTLA
jgi:hypothetical protein